MKGTIMKQLTLISAAVFLLLMSTAVFAQDKNITIFTDEDEDDDPEFFAFMPEVPMLPDFDDMGMHMGMGEGFGWHQVPGMNCPDPGRMPEELNLSKEQTDNIKKIRSAAKKQNIPLKSDIQLKEIELKDLMDADSPDKTAVSAKIKEIDALRTQIKINRMSARIDCRNVLTKEQKEKMEQLRGQRKMMFFEGGKRKMKFKREMRGE